MFKNLEIWNVHKLIFKYPNLSLITIQSYYPL